MNVGDPGKAHQGFNGFDGQVVAAPLLSQNR
jgi:hypothetical protein